MAVRAQLPQRRSHEVFGFYHWGRKFLAGIGRSKPKGPIQEVWINTGKSGEQMETLARDSAVIISIALQYGVPIDVMRHAIMRGQHGEPSGPIGQLLDLIAGEEDDSETGTPRVPNDPVPGLPTAELAI